MNAKLLKEIRKDNKLKFSDGKWHLLLHRERQNTYYEFESLESAILKILSYNMFTYTHLFDWPWCGIHDNYLDKLESRKFRKA